MVRGRRGPATGGRHLRARTVFQWASRACLRHLQGLVQVPAVVLEHPVGVQDLLGAGGLGQDALHGRLPVQAVPLHEPLERAPRPAPPPPTARRRCAPGPRSTQRAASSTTPLMPAGRAARRSASPASMRGCRAPPAAARRAVGEHQGGHARPGPGSPSGPRIAGAEGRHQFAPALRCPAPPPPGPPGRR